MSAKPAPGISAIYRMLRGSFGFLNWWPGETKTEIVAGAILTQQTSWRNVERALANLKAANALDESSLASMPIGRLEQLVRPSGFYRQKARRLKAFFEHVEGSYGTLEAFLSMAQQELRSALLEMDGIGEETADSIVLYAAEKPSFVIDAYTRRAMHRIAGTPEHIGYAELQGLFERSVRRDVKLYKDMHAQFVELGKRYCRPKPLCQSCPLNSACMYAHMAQKAPKSHSKKV